MIVGNRTAMLPATIRRWFYVPGPGPYFMAHSAGAKPVAAGPAIEEEFLKPWRDFGGDAWNIWLPAIDGFRDCLATIIGGAAEEICPQVNVSAAFEHYLGALPELGERRTILMSDQSFPSLAYVAMACKRLGFDVQFLPHGSDPGNIEAWKAAITEQTAVVLVMHVHSNSGVVTPVPQIATAAHAMGARCVVDLAQSAGIVPIAVRHWGVDAAVGSCVKWLSGGPGAGYLWVPARDFDILNPCSVGWFSHEEPFEMDIHNFRFAPDALRFWGGTPHLMSFIAAKAGIDTILSIGVNVIRAHNQQLQCVFRTELEKKRPQWRWPSCLVGGTLSVDIGKDLEAVRAKMKHHHVRVDFRGSVLRISFGAWNTVEEVMQTAALLAGPLDP